MLWLVIQVMFVFIHVFVFHESCLPITLAQYILHADICVDDFKQFSISYIIVMNIFIMVIIFDRDLSIRHVDFLAVSCDVWTSVVIAINLWANNE